MELKESRANSQKGEYLSKSCHIKNRLKPFNISLPPSGKKSRLLTQHLVTSDTFQNPNSGSLLISNLCCYIKLLAFPPNNSHSFVSLYMKFNLPQVLLLLLCLLICVYHLRLSSEVTTKRFPLTLIFF